MRRCPSCRGRRSSASTARPRSRSGGRPVVRVVGEPGRGRAEPDHPAPGLLLSGTGRLELLEREELRRAEDVPYAVEAQAAPAAARDERNLLVDRLRARRRGVRESGEGEVPRLGRRREAAERVCELGLLGRRGREQGDDAEGRLRQGARLVDADRVDGGERLDRVQLLREGTGSGHAQRRRSVGDRDEQDEPLRDESDHAGDRGVDGMPGADVLLPQRHDQHRAERHHHREEHVEETVDRSLERGARMAERAGGPGDALGVAVRADRCDLERAGAFDDEGARPHLVAGRSLDRPASHPSGSIRPRTGRSWRAKGRRRPPGRRARAARDRPRRPATRGADAARRP